LKLIEGLTNLPAAGFGTSGIWNYDGSAWSLLTILDFEDMNLFAGKLNVNLNPTQWKGK